MQKKLEKKSLIERLEKKKSDLSNFIDPIKSEILEKKRTIMKLSEELEKLEIKENKAMCEFDKIILMLTKHKGVR